MLSILLQAGPWLEQEHRVHIQWRADKSDVLACWQYDAAEVEA